MLSTPYVTRAMLFMFFLAILHRVAELEMIINFFLSHHFSKNKETKSELLVYLFCTNRITLDSKIELFCDVIGNGYPEFLTIKPKCKKELRDIAEKRNQFAHLAIDITDAGIESEQTISLTKWKGKIEVKNYSYKMVNDLVAIIYSYTCEIGKLVEAFK